MRSEADDAGAFAGRTGTDQRVAVGRQLIEQPLGQSMALWTATFLACDLLDSRSGWRDYWLDWLFASAIIALYDAGEWRIAGWMGSRIPFQVVLPQLVLAIFCYPLVARLIVALDRWRLAR